MSELNRAFIKSKIGLYKALILLFTISINGQKLIAQTHSEKVKIPQIYIDTKGQEILDEPSINAHMRILVNGQLNNSIINYNGEISIEIRGSTSQSFPKKQYKVETINPDGSNNNISLLNMPKENDWILYAPYCDKSLIRNALAYELFASLGHYAPRTQFCELFINNEYTGVYVLTEKIKRDKNRVNLAKLKPDDNDNESVTGGYLLSIDRGGSCRFSVENLGMKIGIEYPKCSEITTQQKEYITNYIYNFDQSLFSVNYTDTVNGYRKYIDLNSCIDYLIINELAKNIDAYRLSTYMHKTKNSNGGKLCFGPVWDFNIAFGNVDYMNGYRTDSILAYNYSWWNQFLQDTNFNNRLKQRWFQLRSNQLSNKKITKLIDSLTHIISDAQIRNFNKWDILSRDIWPNYYVGHTYENEINFLKSWVLNRANWMDVNLPGEWNGNLIATDANVNIYPNPYKYFFTYAFSLEKESIINLKVYNASGFALPNLITNKQFKEGYHKLIFNESETEHFKSNNLYFIVLEVNNTKVSTKKIIKQF